MTTNHEVLPRLADLLPRRDEIDREIAIFIGRPALTGHIGEFIASRVFDIELYEAANHAGSDGVFRSGPLMDKAVNVKFYSRWDGLLDVPTHHAPDYLLVLVGPKVGRAPSPNSSPVCLVERAFVFEHRKLVAAGVKPGIAASVKKALWDEAEVYPKIGAGSLLAIAAGQRELLALFAIREFEWPAPR